MLALVLACAAIQYEPSVPDIPILHVWTAPPLLVICPGVSGGFGRWEQAAKPTARHGARWHGVVPSACEGLPARGEVWVVPMGADLLGANTAGLTLLHVDRGVAAWGMTGVSGDAALSWAPEHELLHAQGLDHHTMTEHVMNRDIQSGGWGWDGVRAALRAAWAE